MDIRMRFGRSCLCGLAGFVLLAAGSVQGQATFHVSPAGSHTPPFNSWGTASTNIQIAINAASAGDTVQVTNGTYNITAEIIISNGVKVVSVNGPALTIVNRSANSIRLFKLTHADAWLSGFKLLNGYRPATAPAAHGAGFYMSAGTVSNCLITGCDANRGSMAYLTGGLFTHSVVSNNTETGNSGGNGGVYLNGGNALIRNCTIIQNRPGSEEAGIMGLLLSGACSAVNCRIINNKPYSVTKTSVAVGITGTGGILQNCLVADNPGRGVQMTGAGTVQNCTISRNVVYGGIGNGIYQTLGKVLNTIAYDNGAVSYARDASDYYRTGGSTSNSCMGVLLSGGGNIESAPRFMAPATGDFTLRPGSPCLDTAMTLAAVTDDLDGTARPIDGDGSAGAAPDMGCYENPAANAGTFRCGFTTPIYERVGSLSATFTPYAAGPDTTITRAIWDFGDGSISNRTDLSTVNHTFGPGAFTITLTLTNSLNQTAVFTATNDIRVGPVGNYVSPAGSHTFPYDTWAKAATSIQPAIDALLITNAEKRTVTVTNGSYGVTAEVTLLKPVRLQSVNGSGVTIIKRTANVVRVARLANADAWITGFTVTNGNNGGDGSGISVTAGTVSNCIITHCTGNRGSALYMTGAGSKTTHSIIRNNLDAGNSGGSGGVRMLSGAVLQYCTLTRNRAGSEDSGVMAVYMLGNSTVSNCVVTNNIAYNATKAEFTIRMQAGDTVRNCLIANNPGRGIHMAGGTVDNCTITKNTMYGDTANGIYMTAGTVQNGIVWDNGPDNSKNLTRTGGTFIYGDVNPAEAGTGNKSSDPLFIAPGTDNFHLDPASPLINVGTNLGWMTGGVDLDGSNRIIAATVDMGCYEAPDPGAGPLSCNFDAPATEGLTNLLAVFTASATGSNTNLTWYSWTFGDSNSESGPDKPVVTNLYTTPGYYTVTLVVSNALAQAAVRAKTNYVYIAPQTAYVATNGTHIHPYDTWVKAATNIQDAIDIARVEGANSTRVMVSNGLYRITAQLELLKGVTVRSQAGRDATMIRRISTAQRVIWINHADAVLDGFSLTNGAVSGILLNAGTVKNCVVANSSGDRSGGAMVMSAGLVSNCVFKNSWDTGNSGGCGGVVMGGGTMIDCQITGNRGGSSLAEVGGLRLTGGQVWNTVIASNVYGTGASGTAGGVAISGSATLRNSLVHANNGVGVYQSAGSVVNGTVVRNSLQGMTQAGGGTTNTIIYFNNNGGANLSGAGTQYRYSCSADLAHDPGGTGNINLDPQFTASGSGYGTASSGGDYRPIRVSPCVEAGFEAAWMADATDLDGNLRILNIRPDMGAYETFLPAQGSLFLIR
ncbi:MAG: hypothetical protein A2498_00255 [Lentisphaerae bacterium RIFOXYC12_FULL_60_16]|nr:MAG: hypothetical protein A2498_00255 [Lentisphaerae bacterium RIFOXYC12_FULL_60_16]